MTATETRPVTQGMLPKWLDMRKMCKICRRNGYVRRKSKICLSCWPFRDEKEGTRYDIRFVPKKVLLKALFWRMRGKTWT